MSTIWTPGGERPVRRSDEPVKSEPTKSIFDRESDEDFTEQDIAQAKKELEDARAQLAEAPAEEVIANHCYGLFELAALYLSSSPPALSKAKLAIDALGCLVDGLGPRLGEPHDQMKEALAQIRLAYIELGPKGES